MTDTAIGSRGAHRFAYAGLDRLIHEKARLSVLTALVSHPGGVLFTDLKQQCCLTDGNLSRHLQVLESAALVSVEKSSAGCRTQTLYHMTTQGRMQFLDYLVTLEQVIRDAARAISADPDAAATAPAIAR